MLESKLNCQYSRRMEFIVHHGSSQEAKIDPDTLPTLLGHPTGLYTLFFAEMWERFSYYGMRALLLFYMIKGFGFGDQDANAVYGAYTALIYMTPLFGGMIADRMLGKRTAVVIGGLLMAAGHLLMMIPSELWFFWALSFLIAGNGFFKPNISTQVGNLYKAGDSRIDRAYSIFYVGINVGAFFSPLVCGTLAEDPAWGYKWGFCAAGIGMVIGQIIYLFALRTLPN